MIISGLVLAMDGMNLRSADSMNFRDTTTRRVEQGRSCLNASHGLGAGLGRIGSPCRFRSCYSELAYPTPPPPTSPSSVKPWVSELLPKPLQRKEVVTLLIVHNHSFNPSFWESRASTTPSRSFSERIVSTGEPTSTVGQRAWWAVGRPWPPS